MGDMTVEELKEKKMWFLWSAKPAKNGKVTKRIVNIHHQLQRTSDMRYIVETTKTDAGTRKLPITEDVAQMFQAIIEDRNAPKVEKSIDG